MLGCSKCGAALGNKFAAAPEPLAVVRFPLRMSGVEQLRFAKLNMAVHCPQEGRSVVYFCGADDLQMAFIGFAYGGKIVRDGKPDA